MLLTTTSIFSFRGRKKSIPTSERAFRPSINVSKRYKICQNVTQEAGRVSATAVARLLIIKFCKKTSLFIIYTFTNCSYSHKQLFKMSILIKKKCTNKQITAQWSCIYILFSMVIIANIDVAGLNHTLKQMKYRI